MKFGMEFTAQMVQEWQQAYMDYNFLKGLLKDIQRFKQRNSEPPVAAATARGLKRRVTLYRAFSGLTTRYKSGFPAKNEDEVILVRGAGEELGEKTGEYKMMFLRSADEGGEYELEFFRRLDVEFNKVIEFYRKKVEEVIVRADELSRQMNALIALRIKVENPVVEGDLVADLATDYRFLNSESDHPYNVRNSGWSRMEVIHKVSEEETRDGASGRRESNITGFRPASLEVLDHVKINMDAETPVSGVVKSSSRSDLSFSKQELKKAEELMTQALSQFYQKLKLLKSYCFLNQLAFSKIMKKYDKITSRNASKAYLKTVDDSDLGKSNEVTMLMGKVEATFVKHFANGNHRKGMAILRPKAKRERHRITFLYGLFSGCAIALMLAIGVLIHARNILNSPERYQYMDNIFPLYSLFGFVVLHMLMYSGNIFFWKRYRINYPFIFGLKQGTELGYTEVLLLSTALAVLTLGGAISNLDMEMDPRTEQFKAVTELVPLGILTILLLITFCPFNIIYRSSRFFLIKSSFHCLFAPFYKVTLPDFFLADQLTSQVQAFRNLEFFICYYAWGDFRRRSSTCRESEIFKVFYLVVAIIPYWFRVMQCLRRLFEEHNKMHALNGLKYFSTIVAIATRTIYEYNKARSWLIMAAVSSVIATILGTYWDIVIDWGLLRRNSRNPWLRDRLSVPNKSVYFVAMVLNVLLRLAWMQTVLGITQAPLLHRTALTAIVAALEIIRRGIWNFFRLENEHLNNVGKYRAFKSVPLPFYYDDDESKNI